ncbi:uncharacterized protein C2845_PM17G00520 [Panicum miliaceum]|uniref:Uncharacterized protein n=1 Tax=Panicum miliaceum TaxID=4540 RepID=A0A3L6Q3Q6_PANMI|nr:uncharacterized protein C2845_PM17G00520 [Panicum miliaceum]
MLLNYGTSTPPLADADHHLPNTPHCLGELPSFCRRKSGKRTIRRPPRSVRRTCKEWLKNPMNIALLLWLLCVAVAGGMLVLLLLGLLDGAFPAPAERNRWIEINNQVLNALFTLMSLYQHPALCHHLFLLCRWRPQDSAELRAAYCKGAAPRAGERVHMAVVVALLHLTVVCQYVLCGLYWGYTKSTRPELAEDGFFVLGIVAPVAAAVYTVCSPLGKDGQCHELACSNSASETQSQMHPTPIIGHVVIEPQWAGGMFDCGGDTDTSSAWCLSLSCTFCVFGWNMERLGFGNAYVHAVTFALLCLAPLWVLGVSALHIRDCVIGDMEVRTANLYHVDGEILYSKVADGGHEERQPLLLAVSSDHGDVLLSATNTVADGHLVVVHDETTTMAPPVHQVVVVQVEDEKPEECSVLLSETVNSSIPTSEYECLSESSRAMVVKDYYHRLSSAGNWRVEKVKKLINMVTLVSLLILLYTRGIIL